MISQDYRDNTARAIRHGFSSFYKGEPLHPDAHLYWSIYTSSRLIAKGIVNFIAGGSYGWPRVSPEVNTEDTHYSVEWGGGVWTETGEPHVHSWIVIPDHREIVDMTTLFVPEKCLHETRLPWFYDYPPKHLWCNREELRHKFTGAVYIPNQQATDYVRDRINRIYGKEIQPQL